MLLSLGMQSLQLIEISCSKATNLKRKINHLVDRDENLLINLLKANALNIQESNDIIYD